MKTFSISWSALDGPFGFTEISDCESIDDAISCFLDCIVGGSDVPHDATIDAIKLVHS